MPDLIPIDADRCLRTVIQDDRYACIELRGELDLAGAPALERLLDEHLLAGRCFLRVDAHRLKFLDCTALRVLVHADEDCRARHGSLTLVGASDSLRRLLTLARLDGVLRVEEPGSAPESMVGGALS